MNDTLDGVRSRLAEYQADRHAPLTLGVIADRSYLRQSKHRTPEDDALLFSRVWPDDGRRYYLTAEGFVPLVVANA